MKYYTGRGDSGETDTVGLGRISKGDRLACAIGDIDELNSSLGVAIANLTDEHLSNVLRSLQNKLFIVGAELSSSGKAGTRRITPNDVRDIEEETDGLSVKIPELKRFVLPGGSVSSSHLHMARAVSRRAERSIVMLPKGGGPSKELLSFINRVSSLLFVAALYMNAKEGVEESHPSY